VIFLQFLVPRLLKRLDERNIIALQQDLAYHTQIVVSKNPNALKSISP
jgi:hypothetical protein